MRRGRGLKISERTAFGLKNKQDISGSVRAFETGSSDESSNTRGALVLSMGLYHSSDVVTIDGSKEPGGLQHTPIALRSGDPGEYGSIITNKRKRKELSRVPNANAKKGTKCDKNFVREASDRRFIVDRTRKIEGGYAILRSQTSSRDGENILEVSEEAGVQSGDNVGRIVGTDNIDTNCSRVANNEASVGPCIDENGEVCYEETHSSCSQDQTHQKPQDPTSSDNSDAEDEGGNFQLSYEDAKLVIRKCIDKVVLSVKKSGSVSKQLSCLRNLSEKLSFALAYAVIGNKILGKSEVKELSAVLIKIIDSYPYTCRSNACGRLKANGAHKEYAYIPQPDESQQLSELVVLACNCLSLMVEDNCEDTKTIMRNGAVRAFVKRLNGKDYENFTENIINLIYKISFECPASLTSRELRAAMIRRIDLLNVHVQRSALEALSNILDVYITDKKKILKRKGSQDHDFRDIRSLIEVISNHLFSADDKVVEYSICCVAKMTELSISQKVSTDILFNERTLKKLVSLLAMSIGLVRDDNFNYTSLLDASYHQNSDGRAIVQASKALTLLMKTMVFIAQGAPEVRRMLVYELNILDIPLCFFTRSNYKTSDLTPIDFKTRVMDIMLGANDSKAFDMLYLLGSLISFQPKVQDVVALLDKDFVCSGSQPLPSCGISDTEIADKIVESGGLMYALIELLDANYNFYLTYGAICIFLKVLWCSSNLYCISNLLTSSRTISKIIYSCFSIGISYFRETVNSSLLIKEDQVPGSDPIHKPHYIHARVLFEQGLSIMHLLAIRFGPRVLVNMERNGVCSYLSYSISVFKKYYGTVKYYMRSRRGMINKMTAESNTTEYTRPNMIDSFPGSLEHYARASSNDSSDLGDVYFDDNISINNSGSPPRCTNGLKTVPTVKLSELKYENTKNLPGSTKNRGRRACPLSVNAKHSIGIAIDSHSDDSNRIIFRLAEHLMSQISAAKNDTAEYNGISAIILAAKDLHEVHSEDDPLNMKILKKIAEELTDAHNTVLTGAEFINSGFFQSLFSYMKVPTTNLSQLECDGDSEDKSIDSSCMKVRAFLHVFMGSPNPLDNGISFYVPNAGEVLINLTNDTLSLLGLFPYLTSKKFGNFSIPPRGVSVLRSYTRKAHESIKKAFFWTDMLGLCEYFMSQLENRVLLKIVSDEHDGLLKNISGMRISAHHLSNFSNLRLYMRKTAFDEDLMMSNFEKLDRIEMSDAARLQLKPYILKIYDKDIKHPLLPTNKDNLPSSDESSDYEMNDSTTEMDDITNFFVGDVRDDSFVDVNFLPQDERQLFGINDSENPNAPVVIDLTNTDFQSILDPDSKTHSIPSSQVAPEFIEDIIRESISWPLGVKKCKPRYSFRKRKDVISSSQRRGQTTIMQSSDAERKLDVVLFIDDVPISGDEMISKALYERYANIYGGTVRCLYDRYYEIGVKLGSDGLDEGSEGISHLRRSPSQPLKPESSVFSFPARDLLLLQKLLFDSKNGQSGHYMPQSSCVNVPFINSAITARVLRQLEVPTTAFSKLFPRQYHELLTEYKFLFPLRLRQFYFEIMSFNIPKVTHIWKERTLSNLKLVGEDSRYVNKIRSMGHPTRVKFKITRSNILETAMWIFFKNECANGELTVEYKDEVGAGLGPTLEFYTNICVEIQKVHYSSGKSTVMFPLWRCGTPSCGMYVSREMGLFPAPIPPLRRKGMRVVKVYSKMLRNVLKVFALLGSFIAKSIADSRLIDMPLNKLFIEMAFLGRKYTPGVGNIKLIEVIDHTFYKSLKFLMKYLDAKNEILNSGISYDQKVYKITQINIDGVAIEDMCLYFTYPGYDDFELIPNGANVPVNIHNIEEYIECLIDYTIGSGIEKQLSAFIQGFNSFIPIENMRCFYAEEIMNIVSDFTQGLTFEEIISSIKTDHGYTTSSPTIINFAKVVSSFTTAQLRMFVQFVTGSSRLPIDGLKGLSPQLTIVKRFEECANPDDHLPSVMTCVNYLKLPDYSSIDVLRHRLLYSIVEGLNSFHLS